MLTSTPSPGSTSLRVTFGLGLRPLDAGPGRLDGFRLGARGEEIQRLLARRDRVLGRAPEPSGQPPVLRPESGPRAGQREQELPLLDADPPVDCCATRESAGIWTGCRQLPGVGRRVRLASAPRRRSLEPSSVIAGD